jgi:hypothetical protein
MRINVRMHRDVMCVAASYHFPESEVASKYRSTALQREWGILVKCHNNN